VEKCLAIDPGHGNSVVFVTCLRRIAAPLGWNPTKWDRCAAEAFLHLIKVSSEERERETALHVLFFFSFLFLLFLENALGGKDFRWQ
jgi:hypothetical protein